MKKIKITVKYIFLIIIALFFIFPIVYMLANSVMSTQEISKIMSFVNGEYVNLKFIPDEFSLMQFYQVFFRKPVYLLQFWNSFLITMPTIVGQVIVSSLAAFAFAKLKFPGRDKIFFIYIILLIIPLQVTLVPNYIILDKLNLLNSFFSIILPGTFSAFGICLLRQSIRYISNSAIEAALVDGASYFKIFTKIILPQVKGGIISLVLLTFIDNWNVVEQPLIYFSDYSKYPLSLTLSTFNNADNGVVFACSVMFMIPALIIYFLGEKDLTTPFVSANKD